MVGGSGSGVLQSENPQTWNRYSYTLNNPVKFVDPDGRTPINTTNPNAGLGPAPEGGRDLVAMLKERLHRAAASAPTPADRMFLGLLVEVFVPASETEAGVSLALGPFGRGAAAAGSAARGTSKTVGQMADDLAGQVGRNRVSGRTAGGKQIDIDLRGKSHFDKSTGQKIDTPHVHEATINVGPNGKVNLSNKTTRPATKEDIRIARRLGGGERP